MTAHGPMWVLLLPLLSAALLLVIPERLRRFKGWLSLASVAATLTVAYTLLTRAADTAQVYLAGNWAAPFGIVLVLDRLSALMVLLACVLTGTTLLFAKARWDRAGAHFHSLLQLQLLGLNGAFLTGDLFNLFVFFEVMLAASYGLLLHGSGRARILSGLHYVALNLVASSLFLVGAALIYGVTGTLNMADIAVKAAGVAPQDAGLLRAGAAILATAFLAKAAMWPLGGWLVAAYSAASAPVAALFAIMTKVGFYAIARLWLLSFPGSDAFGQQWLLYGGLTTLACAGVALLAARRLERIASLNVLVSAGTLLACLGLGSTAALSAALFYLVISTLGVAALFLLAEWIERSRTVNELPLDEDHDHVPGPVQSLHPPAGVNLDDEQQALVGQVIPWTMAFLGMALIVCALWVIGMPPLAGFAGKLALFRAALGEPGALLPAANVAFMALLLLTGIASMAGLARVAILRLWAPLGRPSPALRLFECSALLVLFGLCLALTFYGEALLQYCQATATWLHHPAGYIDAVHAQAALPNPSEAL